MRTDGKVSTLRRLVLGALASITFVPRSTQAPAQSSDATVLLTGGNESTVPSLVTELSLLNSSTASFNVSLGLETECDGWQSGLVPASCKDIVPNSLLDPLDDTPKRWGPRDNRGVFDFPFPQRFIGCEHFTICNHRIALLIRYAVDGACSIDVTDVRVVAIVSQKDFVDGVTSLIDDCVVNNRGRHGGHARDLGEFSSVKPCDQIGVGLIGCGINELTRRQQRNSD